MIDSPHLLWTLNGAALFRFPRLEAAGGMAHGVFTRRGGVSGGPFRSLNTSYGVGDHPEQVDQNLKLIQAAVGARQLVFLNQCHGERIVTVSRDAATDPRAPVPGDGLMTDLPGLGLLIKQADCQAVILADPVRRAVANVHCGWRGNVANILGRAVTGLQAAFGSRPGDLLAAIGPSLGPCCAEFVDHEQLFPQSFRRFLVARNHFDLWALSLQQLVEAGVREENVELARICTRCRTDWFYSYRGEGHTGRFATVVMIK